MVQPQEQLILIQEQFNNLYINGVGEGEHEE